MWHIRITDTILFYKIATRGRGMGAGTSQPKPGASGRGGGGSWKGIL